MFENSYNLLSGRIEYPKTSCLAYTKHQPTCRPLQVSNLTISLMCQDYSNKLGLKMEALESGLCDVKKIRLKGRDATRSKMK